MDKKIYTRAVAAQWWYQFPEALVYALLLRPTPKDLIYSKGIKYGEGKKQYLNTYTPKANPEKKKPAMIYIHGGAWVSGITEMRNSYIRQWAEKGFFTAAISYTYAPQKLFPDTFQELFDAIDYLYDHREELNIDTDNIVLCGESAGGYFISHVMAACIDFSEYAKRGFTFRCADKIKIKALVSLSGCFNFDRLNDKSKKQSKYPDLKTMFTSFTGMRYPDFLEWLKTDNGAFASPKITAEFAPMFMAWGTQDLLRYESFDMAKELETLGVKHELFKADGIIAQHAWTIVPLFKKARECFEDSFKFVGKFITEHF